MNLCVLASGKGSNLRAVIKAEIEGKIKSKVKLVISNNSGSDALKSAAAYNIPGHHLSRKLFKTEKEFINKFLLLLKKYNIDLIVLAGYMKIVSPVIIRKYRSRIINIHPALLPKFGGKGMYGIHVHEAVINSGDDVTGASVHFVDEKYDHGAVILQKKVKVKKSDTPEVLQKRVLRAEHKLYPEAIKLIETEKIPFKQGRVIVK